MTSRGQRSAIVGVLASIATAHRARPRLPGLLLDGRRDVHGVSGLPLSSTAPNCSVPRRRYLADDDAVVGSGARVM